MGNQVLLITPPVESGKYKSLRTAIPHVGIAYLAGFLESKGISCDVIDGKLEGLTIEEVCRQIVEKKPQLLGLSAMTPDAIAASKIATSVKLQLPDTPIVMGGPHAIAIPYETLREFPAIDFVVTGEGEEVLVELFQTITAGHDNFEKIDGLAFRKNGEILVNPKRKFITDLDKLPFPAVNKFSRKNNTYLVLSARGCPYSCTFCMRALGKTVRERSPENVIAEMEWLVNEHNAKHFVFVDETFTLNKNRVMHLLGLYLDKGLHKKASWSAQTRVDRADLEIFGMMKKAGCESVEFGVESGNQEILNHVDKKIRLEQVEDTISKARQAGLNIGASYILGHPYETEKTIMDTINFAIKLRPDSVSIGIMSPYPGTKIWDMAQKGEGNYRLLSTNWTEFTRFGGGGLELANLPRKTLEKWQIKAYILFYLKTGKYIELIKYGFPRWRQALVLLKKYLG